MSKKVWATMFAIVLIIGAGVTAAYAIRTEVPNQLAGNPLLAVHDTEKSLKDIIFETQKLVVMLETDNGSIGSGFLYNLEGDLITNAHVVDGANTVKIKTADARELEGTVIGISSEVDVAVVRVRELAGIEPLRIMRYNKAQVGDDVLAVGSPLGFHNTVTTGIISGVGRSFDIKDFSYSYNDMYQISASIARGNSGGPLVDLKTGAVLGINSAGLEDGVIGFSIPISNVIDKIESWSNEPMVELPSAVIAPDDSINDYQSNESHDETNIEEYAGYLVTHFYDSLNSTDYVYAYSLLGGNWKDGTSYEKFREGYIGTRNIVIDDMHVSSVQGDTATVMAVISADERKNSQYVLSKYQVVYTVGYEKDQLKIISGKGKVIGK